MLTGTQGNFAETTIAQIGSQVNANVNGMQIRNGPIESENR